MKLRLEKGTIKIRLSKQEIKELDEQNQLSEHVFITKANKFTYTVKISKDLEICLIMFANDQLTVTVPEEKVRKWFDSNQIGIKETIITDKGEFIVLTLEEDLPPRKFKSNI